MIYLVTNPTPDSAKSYMMQGLLFTQGTVSSIPISGSINLEGFLPPILLLVMIIAMVVVTVVVVVAVGGVPSILKISFMVIANETNSSFRTIEVERLATHKLL
nr:hypothetical protein [Tanacetum cinerariifolium]